MNLPELPEPDLGYIETDKSRQPAFSARQMREALSSQPSPEQAGVSDEPELASNVVNEACWKFVEALPHKIPGPIWNDLKPAVYAALMHYHRALRPAQQVVPMTDEVKEKALDLLETMFDAYENGVPCHEDNGGGYIGMAFSLDNETFHACADILNAHRPKAHHGTTAQGAQEGV